MRKLHCVRLTAAQREQLHTLIHSAGASARVLDRARVLLLAHDGLRDAEIAGCVCVGVTTVQRLRRRFAVEGLAAALHDRPHPGGPPKLNRDQQALVVALSSHIPPNGGTRWTMQQLADALIARGAVDTISSKTVGRVLKKAERGAG